MSRVSAHSHIKGLGLDEDCMAIDSAAGLVGQKQAREAAGIIVDLIRAKKMAGKALLLAGPPSSGKTGLAMAISHELGPSTPFYPMSGSEVFSLEVKKTAVLMEGFRRALGVRLRETKEVFEGEVIKISPEEIDNPLGSFGKSVSHVIVGLRSAKGSRQLNLDAEIYSSLLREKVSVGDVIHIEVGVGKVTRLGRLAKYAQESDLEADEFVPLPKGNVHKTKEVIQILTLHDLDVSNISPQGSTDINSLMNRYSKKKRTEITEKLRLEVNKVVNSYVDQGIAEVIPGVLFIDEVHMLDIECFTFLNKVLESEFAPIIILATNRGRCRVRGTEVFAPHGIPIDLLDRLVIIRTKPYSVQEMTAIIHLRCQVENIDIDADALKYLGKIAGESSLRYGIQLLTPAYLLAKTLGRTQVVFVDIQTVQSLFLDAKTSSKILETRASEFLT